MTIPICIDISHHQGYPDFDQVALAGVRGMIHKATEGTSFVDSAREENCSRAMDAGIAISTYHWLSPGSDPADQMAFYIDTVRPCHGERVVIDYEQDGCSLGQLHEAVRALLDSELDLQITVYSGHLLKEQLGETNDEYLGKYTDLWLAQYTTETPTWPTATYPQWSLHQYSETGVVPGIDDCYVDFNNFNGSDDEFLRWISPVGTPIPTPPHPGESLVDIHIDAPEGVMVQVTVNGIVTKYRPKPRRRPIKRGPDLRRML